VQSDDLTPEELAAEPVARRQSERDLMNIPD
jgi:hypothetical protein